MEECACEAVGMLSWLYTAGMIVAILAATGVGLVAYRHADKLKKRLDALEKK